MVFLNLDRGEQEAFKERRMRERIPRPFDKLLSYNQLEWWRRRESNPRPEEFGLGLSRKSISSGFSGAHWSRSLRLQRPSTRRPTGSPDLRVRRPSCAGRAESCSFRSGLRGSFLPGARPPRTTRELARGTDGRSP